MLHFDFFFFFRQKRQVSRWTGSKEGWEGKTLFEQSWRIDFRWISCTWHLCWVSPWYNTGVLSQSTQCAWVQDMFADTKTSQTIRYQLWRVTRSSLSEKTRIIDFYYLLVITTVYDSRFSRDGQYKANKENIFSTRWYFPHFWNSQNHKQLFSLVRESMTLEQRVALLAGH